MLDPILMARVRALEDRAARTDKIIADIIALIENSLEHHWYAEAIRAHWKIKGGELRD